jgi:hypothetical protein
LTEMCQILRRGPNHPLEFANRKVDSDTLENKMWIVGEVDGGRVVCPICNAD